MLAFLQLQENAALQESELEQALMGKLQHSLLELGKGFAFPGFAIPKTVAARYPGACCRLAPQQS